MTTAIQALQTGRRLIRRVIDSALRGRLRPVARPVYGLLVTVELSAERLLDRIHAAHAAKRGAPLEGSLTAVIKTFERPRILRRLIASIRRSYPDLQLIVVDDSREPIAIEGVTLIHLPYDSGVSAGRNAGLAAVETPYVLILDDDFVFSRRTRLEPALATIEQFDRIDILGGDVIQLPFYRRWDPSRAAIHPTPVKATLPPGSRIGTLPVCDKVPNFYIARTEALRRVAWDPRIKRLDHADFFTRARGVLTTVFDRGLQCLHAQTPFDAAYMAKRNDYAADHRVIHDRYYGDPRLVVGSQRTLDS